MDPPQMDFILGWMACMLGIALLSEHCDLKVVTKACGCRCMLWRGRLEATVLTTQRAHTKRKKDSLSHWIESNYSFV